MSDPAHAPVSDPAERLADVVIALVVAHGLEGVSIRKVAAAADVSIGAVQHHYPTKAAMVQAAMARVSALAAQRIKAATAATGSPRDRLRAVAAELLGAGPDRAAGGVVWLQRAARAAVDPELAAGHGADWQAIEDLLAALLAACRPDQDAAWHRDAAAALLAHVDGLAVALTTEPARMPAARAERLLAARLDELLGQ